MFQFHQRRNLCRFVINFFLFLLLGFSNVACVNNNEINNYSEMIRTTSTFTPTSFPTTSPTPSPTPTPTPIPSPTITPTLAPSFSVGQQVYLIPSGSNKEFIYGDPLYSDLTQYYINARSNSLGFLTFRDVKTCQELHGQEFEEYDMEFNESWKISNVLFCNDRYQYLIQREYHPFWVVESQLSSIPLSPEGYLLPMSAIPDNLWRSIGETLPTSFIGLPADFKISKVELSEDFESVSVEFIIHNKGRNHMVIYSDKTILISSEFGNVEKEIYPEIISIEPGKEVNVIFKWQLAKDKWLMPSRFITIYINVQMSKDGNVINNKDSLYYKIDLTSLGK